MCATSFQEAHDNYAPPGEYTMFDDLFFFNHSEPYQIERAWDQIKDQV
jgi:hypothetical protein